MDKNFKKIYNINKKFHKKNMNNMPRTLYVGELGCVLLIDGSIVSDKNVLGVVTYTDTLSELQWLDSHGRFMGQVVTTKPIKMMLEYIEKTYGVA